MPWGYIILGLVAGIASGAFGVGGGAIIVPALSVWFGVPYPVAVGTSLALIIPISLSGSITHYSLGGINWKIFMFCGVAGVIGAVLGSLLIQKVPDAYARKAFALYSSSIRRGNFGRSNHPSSSGSVSESPSESTPRPDTDPETDELGELAENATTEDHLIFMAPASPGTTARPAPRPPPRPWSCRPCWW
jgi:uncharacterized membrane protein